MFLKNFKILISYLKSYKSHLIIVIASLISVSVTLLLIGKVFKNLVDNGLTTNNIATINHSIFFICFLIIIFGISSFFRSYYINLIAEKIITTIKVKIYAHLINCEVEQFESMKMGDLISRFSYDTEQIAKLIINFLSFFLRNLIMLIGSIILMSYESPKLSMIVIVSVPILLIPLLKLSKYVRSLSRTTTNFQGIIASNIDESFSNIRVIHAYNKQQDRIDEFINYTQQYLSLSSTRLKSRSLFFALAISAILLSINLVLWIGSNDMVNGNISSGQIISFIYFALVAAVSCGGIAELLSEIQLPLASVDRVFHLLHIPIYEDKIIHRENTKLKSISNIEFDQVDFIYPSRSVYALKNISFKVDAKFISIIGASGSGKSTILQLLLKFYKVNSGLIKINNIDINHINAEHLRSLISYAPQDPCIFSGTIFSNITLSKPNASLEEVEEIAKVTGITKFINKLVNGLHTEVGEKGVKLSGGQKQRIALARALLHNGEILLLDEATSSLDDQDEFELLNDISHFIKDKKIIWIAHRLSSLKNSNEILVINDSQLIFQGSYDALTKQKDLYQTLRLSK